MSKTKMSKTKIVIITAVILISTCTTIIASRNIIKAVSPQVENRLKLNNKEASTEYKEEPTASVVDRQLEIVTEARQQAEDSEDIYGVYKENKGNVLYNFYEDNTFERYNIKTGKVHKGEFKTDNKTYLTLKTKTEKTYEIKIGTFSDDKGQYEIIKMQRGKNTKTLIKLS